jgi:hypothetical protein
VINTSSGTGVEVGSGDEAAGVAEEAGALAVLVTVAVEHANSAADAVVKAATTNHFGLMMRGVTGGILAACSRSERSA